MSAPRRVAVVGAGAVGLTAAADLARSGLDVTVFDSGDPLSGEGSGASFRAAGLCYDAYAEDIDARVAARALGRFRTLAAEGGLRVHETPYVFFARDDEAAGALERSVERMRVHDRDVDLVDPANLRSWGLRDDGVLAAAVAHDACWIRPRSYLRLMADRLLAAGGRLRTQTPVSLSVAPPGVVVEGGSLTFDAVLVAAGAHTGRLLRGVSVSLPLKSYRAQALTGEAAYDGPLWYDATAGTYARPHPGGALVGGGVPPTEATPDEWRRSADASFVAVAREEFTRRTGLRIRPRAAWAGLCTATPDGNPLLGRVTDGVFVAAGWYGHGFMRAPATGEAVARLVRGEPSNVLGSAGVTAFDPTRLDGDTRFGVVSAMTESREHESGR